MSVKSLQFALLHAGRGYVSTTTLMPQDGNGVVNQLGQVPRQKSHLRASDTDLIKTKGPDNRSTCQVNDEMKKLNNTKTKTQKLNLNLKARIREEGICPRLLRHWPFFSLVPPSAHLFFQLGSTLRRPWPLPPLSNNVLIFLVFISHIESSSHWRQ